MRAFFWGIALLLILAAGHLWPKQDALWLVVMPDSENQSNTFNLVQNSDARIVDIVDDSTIIISPSATTSPADFYNKGALLVVNAEARYGCSPPTKNKWAKT